MIKNNLDHKIYFPLSSRIIITVYILVFSANWFCSWQSINLTNRTLINNTIDSALNEQFRIGYSIKMMAENLRYDNEEIELYLPGTVYNLSNSYGEYYAEDSFFRIYEDQQNITIFSNIDDDSLLLACPAPEKDGSVTYFLLQEDNKNILYVSSYIKVYNNLLRLDYIKDISPIIYLQEELAYKTAQILFAVNIALLFLLYLSIKKALAPLQKLNFYAKSISNGDYSRRVPLLYNDEIGQLSVSFNHMADAVEKQIAVLSENARQKELYAANLAHEIKTPLTSIIAYSDYAIKSETQGKKLYQLLEYIKKEGYRLNDLSTKILELNMLNQDNIHIKPCRVDRVIKQVLYTLEPLAQNRNQKIKVSSNSDTLQADETLLISLLTNLCKNALNASKEKSEIKLDIIVNRDTAIITVTDTGIGIPKEELNQIFEPFYMIDKSRNRSAGGHGLGLTFCQSIVEKHQGSLTIDSRVNEGTCVQINLPQN